MASEPLLLHENVFQLICQTFDECFPDNQDRDTILKNICTLIEGTNREAREHNPEIILKPYTFCSDDNCNIARLRATVANYDIELVEEHILAEGPDKEVELTTPQSEDFQGNGEPVFHNMYLRWSRWTSLIAGSTIAGSIIADIIIKGFNYFH